jgi:transcription termination/antitermination protein NusG
MGEKKWYVLRTAGSKEKKVKEYLDKEIERDQNLQSEIAQVLVPVEKKYTVKNGKRVATEKILFPGYVFMEAELGKDSEYLIRSHVIPGLAGFLTEKAVNTGSDGDKKIAEQKAVPLRDDEVRRLLGQQDEQTESEAATEVDYQVGESVKITDGPFNGFDGTVDEIALDRSKIKVIVMIFGRKTLLELSFNQVTKE